MAYNPGSNSTVVQQDLSDSIEGRATPPSKYRGNDGVTGPIEFPTSAELIFPDLEDTSSDDDEGENSAKIGFSKLRKNPSSVLNPLMDPKVELTSKDYKKQEKRLEKDERKREKHERKQEKRARKHPERAPKEPRKRLLRKSMKVTWDND
ncbi:hypothetical protein Daesc_002503 [Daldinia eschscholtzii]|uniref:Uncharacterized protein n=1 Tax=Daldinia eschscholtzii TaxID=292717 RepID=A0AAX6MXT8_9PEZI